MSIPVALADLAATVADRPWGYLVTVGPDLRAHLLAVPTDLRDGVFHADGGRATRANVAERPEVTLVFPPVEPGGYTLIVDGSAVVRADEVAVVPSKGILHRPAIPAC